MMSPKYLLIRCWETKLGYATNLINHSMRKHNDIAKIGHHSVRLVWEQSSCFLEQNPTGNQE